MPRTDDHERPPERPDEPGRPDGSGGQGRSGRQQAERRPETRIDQEHLSAAGDLHYQQARRGPDQHPPHATPTRARRGQAEPDQQQLADDHGAPSGEDESWLQDQGYPKLGRGQHARLTQVEHGPYAGGTQQGTTDRPKDGADGPEQSTVGSESGR